jgi:Protein of unknown function (DUF3489)
LGAKAAPRFLPRRLDRRLRGFGGATATPSQTERRITMSKPKKLEKSPSSVRSAKPVQRSADDLKSETDARSKKVRVIAMLRSPTGTTIAAIMKATGWQPHSVRGFLSDVVRKRLKLNLVSKKVNGNRIYKIASEDRTRVSTRQAA